MSNRLLGILPGLLLAGAFAGRNMGLFGGNQQALAAGMSQKDIDTDSEVWKRLGQQQLPNGQPNQMMAGDPMRLPGATLSPQQSAHAIAHTLPQPRPQMPNGLAGAGFGQTPILPPSFQPQPQMVGRMIPQADAGLPQPRMPMFASLPNRGLL